MFSVLGANPSDACVGAAKLTSVVRISFSFVGVSPAVAFVDTAGLVAFEALVGFPNVAFVVCWTVVFAVCSSVGLAVGDAVDSVEVVAFGVSITRISCKTTD